MIEVKSTKLSANYDFVEIAHWYVTTGQFVQQGELLCTVETTKTTSDIESPSDGFVLTMFDKGVRVITGQALCLIFENKQELAEYSTAVTTAPATEHTQQVITKKAAELAKELSVDIASLSHLTVVRTEDVKRLAEEASDDKETNHDLVFGESLFVEIQQLIGKLKARMKRLFNRSVPTGELFSDRWFRASELGFGAGSSIYDSAYVFGKVSVGQNTWIGPNVILDGLYAPLTIGNNCSIGAGAQIYSHNTIKWALSGGKAKFFKAPVTIGDNCFIAPNSVIGAGVVIGNSCYITAGTYVETTIADNSIVAGLEGKTIGKVVHKGDDVVFDIK